MSRNTFSTIALSMSAGCLATLITACGTGGGQAEPITEADEVTKSASPAAPTSGPASYDVDDVVTWRKQKMAQDRVDRPYTRAVGHCGHHVLHRPRWASDLPVSAWYTPTSC